MLRQERGPQPRGGVTRQPMGKVSSECRWALWSGSNLSGGDPFTQSRVLSETKSNINDRNGYVRAIKRTPARRAEKEQGNPGGAVAAGCIGKDGECSQHYAP